MTLVEQIWFTPPCRAFYFLYILAFKHVGAPLQFRPEAFVQTQISETAVVIEFPWLCGMLLFAPPKALHILVAVTGFTFLVGPFLLLNMLMVYIILVSCCSTQCNCSCNEVQVLHSVSCSQEGTNTCNIYKHLAVMEVVFNWWYQNWQAQESTKQYNSNTLCSCVNLLMCSCNFLYIICAM